MKTSPAVPEKRRRSGDDYVRGQKILADAIFHWKNDAGEDARAAVRFLMHHLATAFRADDGPLSRDEGPHLAQQEAGEP